MTFDKPIDVSYSDMCIYIDEHIYTEDCDLNLVYKYLYFLVQMLARKRNLLKYRYIDSFAVFSANELYFRLTNKKQFELVEGTDDYKMTRIKSILNYIQSKLYFLKVDFERSEYYQEACVASEEDSLSYNYDNIIMNSVSQIGLIEFELIMEDVSKTCKRFLQTLPYDFKSKEWLNIYVSTMLTFLNSITLTNKSKKRIEELANTRGLRQYHYETFYDQEQVAPVLFHLPESMSDYIIVLVRQLKHIVGQDLSEILHTRVGDEVGYIKAVTNQFNDEVDTSRYED